MVSRTMWILSLFLAYATLGWADPSIRITYIPTYGTDEDVSGTVSGVDFASHAVALYIYVGTGWWTKPTHENPTVPINPANGTWSADITTGGDDVHATRIAAFLIPAGATPPPASGESALPLGIYPISFARDIVYRGPEARFISFAGRQWRVKWSAQAVGPGPNLFSADPADVWADAQGLHMSIVRRDEEWYCTETILDESLGLGTYLLQTHGRLDVLEPWIVAGFFTWDDYAPAPYREIDFEYSRWGDPSDPTNAQFVVQPWDTPGNLQRYRVDLTDSEQDLTHVLDWEPDRIRFRVYYGHHGMDDVFSLAPASEWTYEGPDVPDPGNENFCVNFWLCANPPSEWTSGAAFIASDFAFSPPRVTSAAQWVLY